MESYGEELTSVRFALRSFVVSDVFYNRKPLYAVLSDEIALAAKGGKAVFLLKSIKSSDERVEISENVEVSRQIDSLIVLKNQFYYVSDGELFTLDNQIKLKSTEFFSFEHTICVGDVILSAVIQNGVTFSLLENNLEQHNINADFGEFKSAFVGIITDKPVLVVQVSQSKYRLFEIESSTVLKALYDVNSDCACVGLLQNNLLAYDNDKLELIAPASGNVVATYESNIYAVGIVPILPKQGHDEYVIVNTSKIQVLDANLRLGTVIEISEFVNPTTDGIEGLDKEYEPDSFSICSDFASDALSPQLQGDIFKPVCCNINGCTSSCPAIELDGKSSFNGKDYYYIEITAGFELNAITLHYINIADVYRQDGKFREYPFTSYQTRAQERFNFSEIKSILKSVEEESEPTLEEERKEVELIERSKIIAKQPDSITEETEHEVESEDQIIKELKIELHTNANEEEEFEMVNSTNIPKTDSIVASLSTSFARPEADLSGLAEEEEKLNCHIEEQHEERQLIAQKEVMPTDLVIDRCFKEKVFNGFTQLLSILTGMEQTSEIKYDYGYGFNIHLEDKSRSHRKNRAAKIGREENREMEIQLFNTEFPYLAVEEYNLYFRGRLILKNVELERSRAAERELVKLCSENNCGGYEGDLEMKHMSIKSQGKITMFQQAEIEFKDINLEYLRHIIRNISNHIE